jgi:hypothetical protein
VRVFARPVLAIGFGAFFLCAETCLHAEDVLQFPSRPFDLPVYDWVAGGFLLVAGILSLRDWSAARRQYLAAAWAFMLSLLTGASFSLLGQPSPSDAGSQWLSDGAFLTIVVMMAFVALCGLVGTLKARES